MRLFRLYGIQGTLIRRRHQVSIWVRSKMVKRKYYCTLTCSNRPHSHVVVTDTGKCLQASKLAKRNQVLIEGDCPNVEDSGQVRGRSLKGASNDSLCLLFVTLQFASYFEFRTQVKRDSNDPRLVRISVSSLPFFTLR
jgi:hypothetical protein